MAESPGKDVFDEVDPAEEALGTHGADGAEGQDNDAADAGVEAVTDDELEVVIADDDAGEDTAAAGDDTIEGAGAEIDAGADPDEDPEDKSYSQKVRERIAREKRVTQRTREDAAAQIIAERKTRLAAEKTAIEAQESLATVLIDNLDSKIREKTAAVKAAMEAGETDKQLEAQGELDDLRAKKREVEGGKAAIASKKADLEARAKTELTMPGTRTVPPATQNWLSRNRWFGNKAFIAESNHARILDAEISRKGIPVASEQYFKELDRLIARDMPDLRTRAARLARVQSAQPGVRSAVAPVSRAARTPAEPSGKSNTRVVLSAADLETMRTFKLDPTNKEHLLEFARQKRAGR